MVNNCGALPLYDLETVHALVSEGKVDRANKRVNKNLLNLGWKTSTLHAFLFALKEKHRCGTYPEMSAYDGSVEVDADAYKMYFDEENCCEGSRLEHDLFFLKVAIVVRADGERVAVVSIHLDGQP